DGLGDLFGSPYSFERHGRRQTGLSFGSTSEAVQHPSLDWTWGHHVDAYPRKRGFECGRLGQSFDRMLARGVYRRATSANMAVGGRHVHDTAASLGKHHAHFVLHAEERTQDVCVEGRGIVSAVCSVTGPGLPSVPAQLTAASRRPKRATALSTKLRRSS